MTQDPKHRQSQELAKAVERYLAQGGVIKRIPEGQRSDPKEIKNQWGKPRKKKQE